MLRRTATSDIVFFKNGSACVVYQTSAIDRTSVKNFFAVRSLSTLGYLCQLLFAPLIFTAGRS